MGHNWRDQPVNVEGKKFTLGEVNGGKFYHGTRVALENGEVLVAGFPQNFKQSPKNRLCITSDIALARYWANKTKGDEPVIIYEVEPEGIVEPWAYRPIRSFTSFEADEARVQTARIIRRID